MKIAIMVRVLWPGGVQRIAIHEAEGLLEFGHNVDLIFVRDTGRFHYSTKVPFRVLNGPNVKNRLAGKLLRWITSIYSPERGADATIDLDLIRKSEKILENKYDFVYYFDEFSAFFSKRSKKKYGHKVIVLIHESYTSGGPFLQKYIQKRALKQADLVLTNTESNLLQLKDQGHSNVHEIYPGLSIQTCIPSFRERTDLAISVTMWDYGRKPEVFLEIARKLKFGRIALLGDWTDYDYMNSIKRLVEDKNLNDKIEIKGPVDEDTLMSYYKEAKVALRFGYNERGPGMGSLEAISWGIPLIINNEIGAKEVLEEGQSGHIVDENDPSIVASKIERLFSDEKKWNQMSGKALEMNHSLSWDAHNKKLNGLISGLVG